MSALPQVSDAQRRARLAARHRLAFDARIDDVAAIADSLVALHSSDPASVYLTAAARMRTPTLAATASALHDERSLVRHHGMRRTLWVYTPSVARVVHAACTVDLARKEWRNLAGWLTASGIDDPDGWIQQLRADTLAALHRLGPSSARALGKAVPTLTTKIIAGSGKWTIEQSAHTRILLNLGFDGTIVRTAPTGGWTSSEYTWSVMHDWLPEGLAGAEPTVARAELVRRYVYAFGPVTTTDVQWWTGWTAGLVKSALGALDVQQVTLDDGSTAWLLADDIDAVIEPDEWVALLPALDPTAMGWQARGWYLGEHSTFGGPLFDRNGNVGPTVWSNGRVVGGWAQRSDGTIATEYLVPIDVRTRTAVATEAERWHDLIGGTRVTPRFPTPLQKSLATS